MATTNKNKFFTEKRVTVKHKKINIELVLDAVREYLSENSIGTGSSRSKYNVTTASHDVLFDNLTVFLRRDGATHDVEGSFSTDDKWDAFCADMASQLEVRRFGLPNWSYSK